MVLVGYGIQPNTDFLVKSTVDLQDDGRILVDPFLQTNDKSIFAAGDVATFPYWVTGERARVEHYINAFNQGCYAAFNMLGKLTPYGNVPFCWTRHYNKSMQFVGYAPSFDKVYIDGSLADQKFIAYYIKGPKILAVAGMGRSSDVLTMMQAMESNSMPVAEDIVNGVETPVSVRAKLAKRPGQGKCKREGCCQKKPVLKP